MEAGDSLSFSDGSYVERIECIAFRKRKLLTTNPTVEYIVTHERYDPATPRHHHSPLIVTSRHVTSRYVMATKFSENSNIYSQARYTKE